MSPQLPMIAASLAVLPFQPAWAAANSARVPSPTPPVEFVYEARGVYPVVAAPGRVTVIALEPGESLVETNAIAAGDTVRWIIGDTTRGEGATRQVLILVKPTAETLSTNLVVSTQRRSYFVDLRASGRGYLTEVRWRYPAVVAAAPQAAVPREPVVTTPPSPPIRLNFGYRIIGKAAWRPLHAFDDGQRTVIVFRSDPAPAELPPVYRVGADGKSAELLNVRAEGRALIIDGLIDRAELRLGLKKSAKRIRIERVVTEVSK